MIQWFDYCVKMYHFNLSHPVLAKLVHILIILADRTFSSSVSSCLYLRMSWSNDQPKTNWNSSVCPAPSHVGFTGPLREKELVKLGIQSDL